MHSPLRIPSSQNSLPIFSLLPLFNFVSSPLFFFFLFSFDSSLLITEIKGQERNKQKIPYTIRTINQIDFPTITLPPLRVSSLYSTHLPALTQSCTPPISYHIPILIPISYHIKSPSLSPFPSHHISSHLLHMIHTNLSTTQSHTLRIQIPFLLSQIIPTPQLSPTFFPPKPPLNHKNSKDQCLELLQASSSRLTIVKILAYSRTQLCIQNSI